MTREKWHTCSSPRPLLDLISGRASDRKLQLFACACLRHVLSMFNDQNYMSLNNFVEFVDQFADGLATLDDLHTQAWYQPNIWNIAVLTGDNSLNCASLTARCVAGLSVSKGNPGYGISKIGIEAVQTHLLRDIFGDPFQPLKLNSLWLTSDVIDVAKSICETKAFSQMLKLSDALLDAGCNEPAIIHHCQSEGLHVRGCWVVDLLLGKE
jgi:hypothetical protein